MAAALAAVRLRRPQPDGVDAVLRCAEVVHGMRERRGCVGVRVCAVGAVKGVASDSRVKSRRVPFRTSFPRREAMVLAMGQGERDITDMQETDNVSGEWWKSVLIAVHDWSSDKLLGLAELADGSLFFSFGGSDSGRPAAKPSASPRAQGETTVKRSTHNLTSTTRPQRQPSRFRKQSPIPASRKKDTVAQETVAAAQPQAEDKKRAQKAKSEPAKPPRPSSSFFKRSPIPKDRVSAPPSTSKKKSQSSDSPPTVTTPTKEAPAKATPAKAIPSKARPAKAAVDSEQDSPFSSELREILSHGKESAARQSKDTPKSKTDAKSSSAAPAKKIPSKPASEELEIAQTIDNGAVRKDLGSYKLPELRSLAKARGLKGYSKLKKGELVDLLASSES